MNSQLNSLKAALPVLTADVPVSQHMCTLLADKYHANESRVQSAARSLSPEEFLRLFITAHGMKPVGTWQTHTYFRQTDSVSGLDHFFLVPAPALVPKTQRELALRPNIRLEEGTVCVDSFKTQITPQSIPTTTPFWYFHYNPNHEATPFESMTLNLSPSCPESCTLCAGAKTGRVNNGFADTLHPDQVLKRIHTQHPAMTEQLESVAVVTGCFDSFDTLASHLRTVKTASQRYANPTTFRVLEHNVCTQEQFELVVGELGFEVFITLECYDQHLRNIALNGKMGKKGRDSQEFILMIKRYAQYLEAHPELGKNLVRVTYLLGIDSMQVTREFFAILDEINKSLSRVKVVPWLSIFTPYNAAMRLIQQPGFGLDFILEGQQLARDFFGDDSMNNESGGTSDGYARGLF